MTRLHDLALSALPHSRRAGLRASITRLLQDESGQDLIEYALVAALVGLAAVSAMHGLSTKISTSFNSVGSSLTSAV